MIGYIFVFNYNVFKLIGYLCSLLLSQVNHCHHDFVTQVYIVYYIVFVNILLITVNSC